MLYEAEVCVVASEEAALNGVVFESDSQILVSALLRLATGARAT
jgi:hypothetical protein